MASVDYWDALQTNLQAQIDSATNTTHTTLKAYTDTATNAADIVRTGKANNFTVLPQFNGTNIAYGESMFITNAIADGNLLQASVSGGVTNFAAIAPSVITGGLITASATVTNAARLGNVDSSLYRTNGQSFDLAIMPATSNAVDIGSSALPFRDLYLGTNSIYMQTNKVLSLSTNGLPKFYGTPVVGTDSLILQSVLTANLATKADVGDVAVDNFTIQRSGGKLKVADRIEQNFMLLAFDYITRQGITDFGMADGYIDNFRSTNLINSVLSSNQTFVSADHYFKNTAGQASGSGGEESTDGDYKVHVFTSNGSFVVSSAISAEILVVAGGGGGGGNYAGGGGGGGGVIVNTNHEFAEDTYAVTVGTGGEGGTSANGSDGGDSSIDLEVAVGGGGGGGGAMSAQHGRTGGSGGGGGGYDGGNLSNAGAGTSGQGNDGGTNSILATYYGGGGGGGSSEIGHGGSGSGGGDGGLGITTNFSGSNVVYADGGGGGGRTTGGDYSGGTGGSGNGGSGGENGSSAVANTGSGGGGGNTGGAGSDGIVIIRYLNGGSTPNMSLVTTNFSMQFVPTSIRGTVWQKAESGVTIPDSDFKLWASRDGGTNYTQVPLVLADQYLVSSPTGRMYAGIVSVTNQPAGSNIVFNVQTYTNVASRIYGIGWTAGE